MASSFLQSSHQVTFYQQEFYYDFIFIIQSANPIIQNAIKVKHLLKIKIDSFPTPRIIAV